VDAICGIADSWFFQCFERLCYGFGVFPFENLLCQSNGSGKLLQGIAPCITASESTLCIRRNSRRNLRLDALSGSSCCPRSRSRHPLGWRGAVWQPREIGRKPDLSKLPSRCASADEPTHWIGLGLRSNGWLAG